MRGKRAKQLRRLAQENTVGAKPVEYGYVEHYRMAPSRTKRAGKFYQIKLIPTCTRDEYQRLKRDYCRSHRRVYP